MTDQTAVSDDQETIDGEIVSDIPDPARAAEPTPSAPPAAENLPATPSNVEVVRFESSKLPRGYLTLRAGQTHLDVEQRSTLVAIGIDVTKDPGVVPHLRAFIHMCQLRSLDPFAREAYLIGRGSGDNRKWTMQTGIDGYMNIAESTGRLIRVVGTYWAGPDDDDRSFRFDPASGIMRRVWWDHWPISRGYPASAMTEIEHYDSSGNVVRTRAIVDWGMVAPYNDVYEGAYPNKRKKFGEDGKPVQELAAMWQKGAAHMLGKCSRAAAVRIAFPRSVAGIYLSEEMQHLDAAERNRLADEKRTARVAAYQASMADAEGSAQPAPAPPRNPSQPGPDDNDPTAGDADDDTSRPLNTDPDVPDDAPLPDPATDTDPAPEPGDDGQQTLLPEPPGPDDATLRQWLWDELAVQAEVFGVDRGALMNRWVRANRKNPDAATWKDLLTVVQGNRGPVAQAMHTQRDLRGGAYEQVPENVVWPASRLYG